MSAAVVCAPTSPVHLTDAAIISCTGADPAVNAYLKLQAPAGSTPAKDLKTAVFAPRAAGTFEWLPMILPVSGTWVLTLRKASDDSQIATANVTVT
jgi:hypothetical protein